MYISHQIELNQEQKAHGRKHRIMMDKIWKQHAQPEEKVFLEKLLGTYTQAEKQNRCLITDFYERHWMEEVIGKYLGQGMLNQCQFNGGYKGAERQCVVFGQQEYYEMPVPISALKIKVHTGIGKTLSHRDYLGALLGLGIQRTKIGDIVLKPFGAIVIVGEELETFIRLHLTQIGRYQKIEIDKIACESIVPDPKQMKHITGTVPSLRADVVFALAFGMSRTTIVKYLQMDKGKRNGMLVHNSDLVKEGDILTLKGYGKAVFIALKGQTKKDRLQIKIEKYM